VLPGRNQLTYYLVKIVITTLLVVLIAEIAKRSTLAGAILASVPVISVLAMIWLYVDTRDVARVSVLASSVFWLVLPSLVLFVTLPLLLKQGLNFYLSMSISIGVTVGCYYLMISLLNHYGMRLSQVQIR